MLTGVFFTGYGFARFLVEFVRQPDAQFVGPDNPLGWRLDFGDWGLTMGQVLSLPMIVVGIADTFIIPQILVRRWRTPPQ